MGQSLSYFQAWHEWAGGHDIESRTMMGLTILWWGRIGKICAFIGGATVVLDLIGPQRLREWGSQRGRMSKRIPEALVGVAILGFFALDFVNPSFFPSFTSLPWYTRIPLSISALVGFFLVIFLFGKAGELIAVQLCNALERPTPALGIRITSAVMLLVGFHFDLLAS